MPASPTHRILIAALLLGATQASAEELLERVGGMSGDLRCGNCLTQNKVGPVGSAAIGFRFFTGQGGAVPLEVRNYLFADSSPTGIEIPVAASGGQTGVPAKSPGLINLVL